MTRVNKHGARALEVWKFGGASLADAPAIEKAAALIASHRGPLVIVWSPEFNTCRNSPCSLNAISIGAPPGPTRAATPSSCRKVR